MPSAKMHRVLITGAGGRIGRGLRETLRGVYPILRLSDLVPIAEARDGEYNTFEAARQAGVKRIVMATSNHAVGFYPRSQTIDHRVTVRPDSRYGVSKAFSEALASLYSDKHGMGFLCVRIGNYGTEPIDSRRLSIWVSPRDLTQLVRIGLEHPDVRYEIVYGVSGNQRSWYDNSNAHRLGYRPEDDSEPQAAQVLSAEAGQPRNRIADKYQGGTFAAEEYDAATERE